MNTWILVFWIAGYPPFTVVEVSREENCRAIAEKIKEKRADTRFGYVCIRK
jgi:hypothetical protein